MKDSEGYKGARGEKSTMTSKRMGWIGGVGGFGEVVVAAWWIICP